MWRGGASSTLHVLSSGALTEAYIKDLKLFRFSTHPKIAPKIEEMKTEITKYNSLVKSIKPLRQRLGPKGNDTFSLLCFWRANEGEGRPSPTCFMLRSPTPPTRSRRSVSSPCSTTPSRSLLLGLSPWTFACARPPDAWRLPLVCGV